MNTQWTLDEAVTLCKRVELVCPVADCHVALTGGVLYKEGPRKDLDLLFYRVRQSAKIDMDLLWPLLEKGANIKKVSGFGWCYKCTHNGKSIDCFFPEEQNGTYHKPEE